MTMHFISQQTFFPETASPFLYLYLFPSLSVELPPLYLSCAQLSAKPRAAQ